MLCCFTHAHLLATEYVEAALKERAVAGITRVDQLDLTTQPPASSATATATQQPTTSQQAIPGSQQPAGFHQPTSTTVPAASQAGAAASQHRQAGAAASGIPDEDVGEGGRLSIDDVEEGAVDESKLVRSFEIKGDMVRWEQPGLVEDRCLLHACWSASRCAVCALCMPAAEKWPLLGGWLQGVNSCVRHAPPWCTRL